LKSVFPLRLVTMMKVLGHDAIDPHIGQKKLASAVKDFSRMSQV
jgi:hypothetical protein